MNPAAAVQVVRAARGFPWLRAVGVLVLVLWLFWRYFVAPVLEDIDRWTPWDGVVPGSCSSTPQVEPARGLEAMANDAGRAVRSVAEGPPTPTQVVSWLRSTGAQTRVTWAAFEDGAGGRQLLPNAPTPAAPPARQVSVDEAPEDVVARALLTAGATPQEAVSLTAVAGPESGYDLTADNPTSTAEGPWQILDLHGLTEAQRHDPVTAARKALELAREPDGLTRHWAQTVEASKAYEARAAAAVARVQGVACEPSTPDTTVRQVGSGGAAVETAIAFALAQQGKPYRWGAAPMEQGGPVPEAYDCSSLIDSAYLAAGIDLPGRATTKTLIREAKVDGEPQRGDLVFTSAGHVGIALGDGTMVHAPNSQDVVKVSRIWNTWQIRRVTATGRAA